MQWYCRKVQDTYFEMLFLLIKLQITIDFSSIICYNKRVTKINNSYVARVVYLKRHITHPLGLVDKTVSLRLRLHQSCVNWFNFTRSCTLGNVGSIPTQSIGVIMHLLCLLNYKQPKARKENKIMPRAPNSCIIYV